MTDFDAVLFHDEANDIIITKNPRHTTYHVKGAGSFKIQDPLRQLNTRVRYYPANDYWTVPTESYDNLLALLAAVQAGEIPLVDAPPPATAAQTSPGSQNNQQTAQLQPDFVSQTGVTVTKDPAIPVYRVGGNTFPLKDKIKALDPKVRAYGKGPTFYWSVPEEKYPELVALLEASGGPVLNTSETSAAKTMFEAAYQTISLRLPRPLLGQEFCPEGDFTSTPFRITRAQADESNMILSFEGARGDEVVECELRRDRFVFSLGPAQLIGKAIQFFEPEV